MKRSILLILVLLTFSALLFGLENDTQKYTVIPGESIINWTGSKPAGEHHGNVSLKAGSLHFKDGELTGGRFSIDLNTIVNHDVESPEWNKKLVDHLKSEDFFHVEKFPSATFEILKAEKISNDEYTITGFLTVKETTKLISFKAKLSKEGNRLRAISEDVILDRTQWKVEALSKSVFADLKDNYVNDEMRIRIDLVAISE